MENYLIKKARLTDGQVVDILVHKGVIKEIAANIESNEQIISFGNDFVSAGWMDIHTHCFNKFETYGDKADLVGYRQGVCTVVDAGTSGSDTIDELYQQASKAKTRVYSLLNIACTGIYAQNELADLNHLKRQEILEAYQKYPEFIIGIKARMSKSVLGDSGNQPLHFAKELQKELNLPLMVHIGSAPSKLEEIMDSLDKGDIITHIFNPKENGIKDGNQIKECVYKAIEKGIYLDLGHGTDSFSFNVAKLALDNGIMADTISSDIYFRNRINGPVYDLATTMTKLLAIGYSLNQVIDKVTNMPAKLFNLSHFGKIEVGKTADFTIFRLEEKDIELKDSSGKVMTYHQSITPTNVIVKNQLYNLTEDK
ncbi:MAG: amidohydrolase/deacetylase family metallohydrolase [Beduini sp.]|uniref:amidohydrolase/deacetylase family metallohydrolase n=1 Tax=Beduini sp. TaxID=1922300 RepID=UPI0039A0CABA